MDKLIRETSKKKKHVVSVRQRGLLVMAESWGSRIVAHSSSGMNAEYNEATTGILLALT